MTTIILLMPLCSTAFAETHLVEGTTMSFVPEIIYINAGDTVRWEYVSGFAHTVTTGSNCLWDGYFHDSLAPFNPVVEWTVPMDSPQEIPYFCLPHCNEGMTAMIYVTHACNGDVNGDAEVNVSDLLAVIEQWGQADSWADTNNDGIVDVSDLLEIIGSWGPCG